MGMAVDSVIKLSVEHLSGTAYFLVEIAANTAWVMLVFPAFKWYMVPQTLPKA